MVVTVTGGLWCHMVGGRDDLGRDRHCQIMTGVRWPNFTLPGDRSNTFNWLNQVVMVSWCHGVVKLERTVA